MYTIKLAVRAQSVVPFQTEKKIQLSRSLPPLLFYHLNRPFINPRLRWRFFFYSFRGKRIPTTLFSPRQYIHRLFLFIASWSSLIRFQTINQFLFYRSLRSRVSWKCNSSLKRSIAYHPDHTITTQWWLVVEGYSIKLFDRVEQTWW